MLLHILYNIYLLDEDTCSVSLPYARYQVNGTALATVGIFLTKQIKLHYFKQCCSLTTGGIKLLQNAPV